METVIDPESWNDLDMDWTDPDPSKACYYAAIMKAMDERRKALASSGFTPWHYPNLIYRKNRFHIPSIGQLKNWIYDLLNHTLDSKGRCIVMKDEYLNDETTWYYGGPPSLQERLTPVITYPVPGIGTPLSQAKDFLIWAKKTLDAMTMYLYPYMKINRYGWDEYANKHPDKMYHDELEGITGKAERLDRLADLYINDYSEHIIIKSEVKQNVFMELGAESDEYNGIAAFYINLPESIEVRSFAKPHVYCLIKVWNIPENLSYSLAFNDFGYGFEEEKNKVLDLGQITEENGGRFELFKFNLKDMKPYLLVGGRIGLTIQADCYFALDYNCEGGFKFRPDA